MVGGARWGWLGGVVVAGVLAATGAAAARSYILNGYSFGPMPGVNTKELAALLKDQEGARVTEADIAADGATLARILRERHINGYLFTSTAEKDGRVWVIFDLQDPDHPMAHLGRPADHLVAQSFEGASRVSAADLAAATGLKPGDPVSPERINAARQAIVDLYAKVTPGPAPTLKGRMRTTPKGEVTLTWIIGEPR
jgi:lipid-binding SYLF domain-containing protein